MSSETFEPSRIEKTDKAAPSVVPTYTGSLPTIAGRRVALRWLTHADVDALFAVFSNPDVMRYWSSPPMTDVDEAAHLVDDIHALFLGGGLYQWGVELVGEKRIVGTCTLFQIDRRNLRGEIGYALGRAYWGQGLMTDALTALFDHAFGAMHLQRLEADVDPDNAASLRILERFGFVREGVLRERWRVGGGVQDSIILGLLKRDWEARPKVRDPISPS